MIESEHSSLRDIRKIKWIGGGILRRLWFVSFSIVEWNGRVE